MQSDGLAAIVLAASGLADVGLNSPVDHPGYEYQDSCGQAEPAKAHSILPGTSIGSAPISLRGRVDGCQARTGVRL